MTFVWTSQLEELGRVVHSNGTTARIGLNVGTMGEGSGEGIRGETEKLEAKFARRLNLAKWSFGNFVR